MPKKTGKRSDADAKASKVFTDEERAALVEVAKERKTEARRAQAAKGRKGTKAAKGDGEADVLAKIAEMPDADRRMAERIHALVREAAPELTPRAWYGMPAYANAAGKNVCFFLAASKFKSRYSTFGFEEAANLDDGTMWPASFALNRLTPENEARIVELVKKAVRPKA
jgi:hypothetical protein